MGSCGPPALCGETHPARQHPVTPVVARRPRGDSAVAVVRRGPPLAPPRRCLDRHTLRSRRPPAGDPQARVRVVQPAARPPPEPARCPAAARQPRGDQSSSPAPPPTPALSMGALRAPPPPCWRPSPLGLAVSRWLWLPTLSTPPPSSTTQAALWPAPTHRRAARPSPVGVASCSWRPAPLPFRPADAPRPSGAQRRRACTTHLRPLPLLLLREVVWPPYTAAANGPSVPHYTRTRLPALGRVAWGLGGGAAVAPVPPRSVI